MPDLKAPFPWFGGKSRVAHLVWAAFGDVAHYIEPFAGSLAVLLGRPGGSRSAETVNDRDCYLSNFWRAVQGDPESVAQHADWPVNEADLHSRHSWLADQVDFRDQMLSDPDFFDARIAGWWVWGISSWIGGSWCKETGSRPARKPRLHPRGVGVHSQGLARPHLGRPIGCSSERFPGIFKRLLLLQSRLRDVRVCCGDWTRVLKMDPGYWRGPTGVFLDPPYSGDAGRTSNIYAVDDLEIAHRAREWALEHGDHPLFRIALCGYEGEHEMPESWECIPWKAASGYSRNAAGNANRSRERIWFSPSCTKRAQLQLFEEATHA